MQTSILRQLETARSLCSDFIKQYTGGCAALSALAKGSLGFVPSNLAAIHSLSLAVDNELQSLEALESHLRGLKSSVTGLKLSLAATKNEALNTRAPINSLSPELLIHIFTLVREYDGNSAAYWDVFGTRSPYKRLVNIKPGMRAAVTLSSVCKHWRRVAVNYPPLWAQFSVPFPRLLEPSGVGVQVWLNRAKTYPLDLDFEVPLYNPPRDAKTPSSNSLPSDMCRVFSFGQSSIRSLQLSWVALNNLSPLLHSWFHANVADTLVDLSITLRDAAGDPSTLLAWLSRCRAIRKLELESSPVPLASLKLPNLVDLSLVSPQHLLEIDHLAAALRASPNLQRLELRAVKIQGGGGNRVAMVALDNLKHIILALVDPESFCLLLPTFSSTSPTTSLHLSIFATCHLTDALANVIKEFLCRSTITALSLGYFPCGSPLCYQVFRSVPHLTTLRLWALTFELDVLGNLSAYSRSDCQTTTRDHSHPPDTPCLTTLELNECYIPPGRMKDFQNLIEGLSLKQIRFNECVQDGKDLELDFLEQDEAFCKWLSDTVPDWKIE
ncbi:hypothetical protein FS749_003462 [Ceratobasidium sp. UAMH 11750]|nr:hypothetical protein FS749_003462 [Ceratobasidium sp. UAMH 11750]